MKESPLVSVVMPAYNAERYISSAVQTVQAQSHAGWELLIVDDASSDSTLRLAQDMASQDKRIRVFAQPVNGGVAKARNAALEHAQGTYIAFLDSDDLWEPQKLAQQLEFMESEGVLVCYSQYLRIDESGEPLGPVFPPAEVDYRKMLKSNFIGNLTGIYNCEILGKQFFSEFKHEDYVAWLALVKKAGSARGVGQILAKYRVYRGSTSSNKLRTIAWQWRIYRQTQSLGGFRSAILMVWYAIYAVFKRMN